MNLFERNVSVFNNANLTRMDTERRRNMVRTLEEESGLMLSVGREEHGVYNIVRVELIDDNDTSIKAKYVCDVNIKLPNHNSTILVSVFSDELVFNMSWFHLEDDKETVNNIMIWIIENLIHISDIEVVRIHNIKSECLKQWCVEHEFNIDEGFMNRPADDYSVDMMLRR